MAVIRKLNKPTNVVSGESYLDPVKANDVISRVIKELNQIKKSTAQLSSIYSNISKKSVTGDLVSKYQKLAKDLDKLSTKIGNRRTELKEEFGTATTDYVSKKLMAKISELEEKIAKLEQSDGTL